MQLKIFVKQEILRKDNGLALSFVSLGFSAKYVINLYFVVVLEARDSHLHHDNTNIPH